MAGFIDNTDSGGTGTVTIGNATFRIDFLHTSYNIHCSLCRWHDYGFVYSKHAIAAAKRHARKSHP